MKRDNKGFTLMELIIVVSIIGLVVTLGFTNYITSIKRSRDGRRKADLEQVRSALEMCRADTGSYPVGSSLPGTCSTYLSVPTDPLSPTYQYRYNGSTNSYTLCAYLETGAVTTNCTGNCGGNCGAVACNYKTCNP